MNPVVLVPGILILLSNHLLAQQTIIFLSLLTLLNNDPKCLPSHYISGTVSRVLPRLYSLRCRQIQNGSHMASHTRWPAAAHDDAGFCGSRLIQSRGRGLLFDVLVSVPRRFNVCSFSESPVHRRFRSWHDCSALRDTCPNFTHLINNHDLRQSLLSVFRLATYIHSLLTSDAHYRLSKTFLDTSSYPAASLRLDLLKSCTSQLLLHWRWPPLLPPLSLLLAHWASLWETRTRMVLAKPPPTMRPTSTPSLLLRAASSSEATLPPTATLPR